MTLRDPRCDNADCEPDGIGGWAHVEECVAERVSLPVPDLEAIPKGSFLEFMVRNSLTRQVDVSGS